MNWHLAHIIWRSASWLSFFACMIATLWKGGPTEKKGAALIATGFLLSPILTRFDGPGPGIYVQALDTCLTLAFITLALYSRRLWVFVICMCALNGRLTYFVTGYKAFGMYAFVTATGFWLGFAFGIIDYQNTLKRQTLNSALAT